MIMSGGCYLSWIIETAIEIIPLVGTWLAGEGSGLKHIFVAEIGARCMYMLLTSKKDRKKIL